jgi:hypothetical protein
MALAGYHTIHFAIMAPFIALSYFLFIYLNFFFLTKRSGSLVSYYWGTVKMSWKGYERKRFWSDWRYYPRILLEGLRKPARNVRIIGASTELRNRRLQDSRHKRHHFGQLAVYTFCLQKLNYNCGVRTTVFICSITILRSQGSLCNSCWSPEGFWQRVCTLLTESPSFVTLLLVEIVREKLL